MVTTRFMKMYKLEYTGAISFLFILTFTGSFAYGTVRLVGSSSNYEGRVELNHNGSWGPICGDQWDMQDATVVCRMLGYTIALEARSDASFAGRGDAPVADVLLVQFQCNGNETHISQCGNREFQSSNVRCNHTGRAGVICGGKKVDQVSSTTMTTNMLSPTSGSDMGRQSQPAPSEVDQVSSTNMTTNMTSPTPTAGVMGRLSQTATFGLIGVLSVAVICII